jgi:hypothetical protein
MYTALYKDLNERVKILWYIDDQIIHCTKLITFGIFFTYFLYNHLYINYILATRHPEDGHGKRPKRVGE